jgi:peroxiredoxin
MLAVNVEQNVGDVREYLEQNPHSFPVLLDAEAKAQGLYGVYRFPETFLIDKNGRIVEHYLGARDWSSVEFLGKIKSMMKE